MIPKAIEQPNENNSTNNKNLFTGHTLITASLKLKCSSSIKIRNYYYYYKKLLLL